MKKYLLTLGLITTLQLSADAYVDSQHIITEQYLLNTGYSSSAARYIKLNTRDPYAPTDEIYPKRNAKRFFKTLWKKIDPTAFQDENEEWHDIKFDTGFYDLN